jgi:hypothetical protein
MTKHIPTAARYLLGAIFFVFGLNGFLGFLPQPPLAPEGGAFLGALAATGYMFPLIKGTELVAAVLLLSNRFVPLSLALLAPITVNIFAFHALLSPGLALPAAIIALQLYLAYAYRAQYRSMLQATATPAVPSSSRPRSAQAAHA